MDQQANSHVVSHDATLISFVIILATAAGHTHDATVSDVTSSTTPEPFTCAMCPPTAICVQGEGYVFCECASGKTGQNCTDDDPCQPSPDNCPEGMQCYGPCNPNFICEGETGEPHCRGCILGWTGENCTEDLDECLDFPDICMNEGLCTNYEGYFLCQCMPGFAGGNCECERGTECELFLAEEEIPMDFRLTEKPMVTSTTIHPVVSNVTTDRSIRVQLQTTSTQEVIVESITQKQTTKKPEVTSNTAPEVTSNIERSETGSQDDNSASFLTVSLSCVFSSLTISKGFL